MNANLFAQLSGAALTGADMLMTIDAPSKEEIDEILEVVFPQENPEK